MVVKKRNKTVKLHGEVHDIIHVHDHKGKKHKVLRIRDVEFHLRDALQVVLGAALLAVPVGFTQEVWSLGETLSLTNIMLLLCLSLFFISTFVYYNFYRGTFARHKHMFFMRVGATYVLSLCVVAILLGLIGKISFGTELLISFKRIVIVAFPASMIGAVSDSLK